MNITKEIYETLNIRVKHPLLGPLIVSSIIFNWKAIFYLFFSDIEAFDRINKIREELYANCYDRSMAIAVPISITIFIFFIYPYIHRKILSIHYYYKKLIENHVISIESRFPLDADSSLALRESNQKLQDDINKLKEKYTHIDYSYKHILQNAFDKIYDTSTKILYVKIENINIGDIVFVNRNNEDIATPFEPNYPFSNNDYKTYIVLFSFQKDSEHYIIGSTNGIFKIPNLEPNSYYEISKNKPGVLIKKGIHGDIITGKNANILKTDDNGKLIFK